MSGELTPTLDDLARQVAELRQLREGQVTSRDMYQKRLEATSEWYLLEDAKVRVSAAGELVHEAELALRQALEAAFHATGEKKYACGEIKLMTQLEYEDGDAVAYCREHLPNALKLSLERKVFEKVAVAAGLDFVTVTKLPAANLKSDLSAFLEPG